MPVTILSDKIKIAGSNGIPQSNGNLNIFRIYSAAVANADTGSIVLGFKPTLDKNGLPVIVGLPHGITKGFAPSTNTLTLTATQAYTNLDQEILVVSGK